MRSSACVVLLTLACVVATWPGCALVPSRQQPSSTVVPIAGIHEVTGKWEELLKETPAPPPLRYGGDWVTLTIADNGGGDGVFEFSSYPRHWYFHGERFPASRQREIEVGIGKGQATYTLQTKDGKPLLVVDAVDQKGIRYHAELTRAQ